MDPYSFSATSLQVHEKCPARYKAEYIDRGANFQGTAANVGIVCHGTLEDFLRAVFIRKDKPWDETVFWEYFHQHSDAVLGPDRTTELYKDARDLCFKWYHTKGRYEDLSKVKILSLESKSKFEIKTSLGIKPVNYIMDRLDQIGPEEYRIVDYKSNRVALNERQLRKKLQARLYSLMVQIKYPKAERIWVQFEFLRHGQVEVLFTRQDNIDTYRELQRRTEEIINTPDNRVPEVLNDECGYCVRKASCKKLQSNIAVGGVFSKTPEELAKLHYTLTSQRKAQEIALNEIEDQLLQYALKEELTEFDLGETHVDIKLPVRRRVDTDMAAIILENNGLISEFRRFSVTDLDRIIKQKLMPEDQITLLKLCLIKEHGDPTVKVDHSGK
jgi:hypothetical protein